MLPPYGRPGVTSGVPTGSRRRRRGDIHVARMTDAYMRVKRGQSLTCGRIHAAGGHVASLRSAGRHKWRPYGFAAVRRRDDARPCRAGTGRHKWRPHGVAAVRRRDDARPCRARWAPGVTSGAPTECGAVRTNAAGRSGEGAARWMGGRPGPAREVRLSSRGRG